MHGRKIDLADLWLHQLWLDENQNQAQSRVCISEWITFTYKSTPGYHGQDSFVFVISGMDQGKPATGTVKVNVTVQ